MIITTLIRMKTIVMIKITVINFTTIGSDDHDHHCGEDDQKAVSSCGGVPCARVGD